MNEDIRNINNLRILAVDMIENAKSGHPGIALGSAPILYSLYSKIMNVVPDDPMNLLRDRIVLSAGHASSVYYAMLHAFGYKISMEDLKNFRKNGSITPGHPEYRMVPGVDASTGPLGQGIGMGVGMALAERYYEAYFNTEDIKLLQESFNKLNSSLLIKSVDDNTLLLSDDGKLSVKNIDTSKISGLEELLEDKVNTAVTTELKSAVSSIEEELQTIMTQNKILESDIEDIKEILTWQEI